MSQTFHVVRCVNCGQFQIRNPLDFHRAVAQRDFSNMLTKPGTHLDYLALANKTPVSWLHEVCTRNNITPKYDLLQVEGVIHEPIFQYRLTLEHSGTTYEETGTGKSKKEAKHNAARAMLASMEVAPNILVDVGEKTHTTSTLDDSTIAIHGANDDSDLSGGNPVGILQELCMKMKYPPPTYGVHSEEGLPHERLFAMACTVGDQFIQVGKGKSKKLAKRHAAHLMAEYLRNMPLETSSSVVYDEDDDKIIERIQASRLKRGRMSLNNNKSRQNKSDMPDSLIKQFIGMTGPIVSQCDEPNFIPEDPMKFVDELGEEQNFQAMYVDFEDLSVLGKYQCIVQLTLEPPAVLFGEGSTKLEAKQNAAIDVVNFFARIRKVKANST